MLLYFKTNNYRSFEDEVNFSMVASSYNELKDNCVPNEKYKIDILKSAVVYGANASGKSNLLKALADGAIFIRSSFREESILPFKFNKHSRKNEFIPSVFQYGILIDGIHYDYSFKINSERVLEERLLEYQSQKPIKHFERVWNDKLNEYDWSNFSKHFTGEKESMKHIANLNHKALFLSICAQGKLPIPEKVHSWFKVKLMFCIDIHFPGSFNIDLTLDMLNSDKKFSELVLKELENSDFIIKGLKLEPIENPNNNSRKRFNVLSYHNAKDKNGDLYDAEFNFYTEESSGTRRFLSWLGIWLFALETGSTLIVDEFGNSMHTFLSKYLINKFNSPKQRSAQLIFSTHDTNHMSMEVFRRDQIWITERDAGGNSHLIPLSEFGVRKGQQVENLYLSGQVGGVPHIIE
jgi:AAA15 family ATPase/GTPase